MEKVIVIGRGCVGATVLNNIYKAGNVYSLMDDERYKKASPLIFNGRELDVETISPSSSFKADLIINTVKNFDLESTLPLMSGFVGEKTVILPLQNGLESEEIIGKCYGQKSVMRAYISHLSTHREGAEVTSFSPGVITFGEDSGEISKRVEFLTSYFDKTEQKYEVSGNIRRDQWVKFMNNTCFNTLTALMEYDYGTFMRSDNLIRCIRLVAREVVLVAKEEGIVITQDDIERMIRTNLSLPPRGVSSTLDDIMGGRRTENAYFAGTLSKKGRRCGVKTPYSDFLYMLLEARSGR